MRKTIQINHDIIETIQALKDMKKECNQCTDIEEIQNYRNIIGLLEEEIYKQLDIQELHSRHHNRILDQLERLIPELKKPFELYI